MTKKNKQPAQEIAAEKNAKTVEDAVLKIDEIFKEMKISNQNVANVLEYMAARIIVQECDPRNYQLACREIANNIAIRINIEVGTAEAGKKDVSAMDKKIHAKGNNNVH